MVGEAAAASGSFPPALALALACSAVGSGLLLGGRNYTTSCFQQPRLAVFHPCSIRGQNSWSPDRRALAPSNDSSIRPVRLLKANCTPFPGSDKLSLHRCHLIPPTVSPYLN